MVQEGSIGDRFPFISTSTASFQLKAGAMRDAAVASLLAAVANG